MDGESGESTNEEDMVTAGRGKSGDWDEGDGQKYR